MKKRLSVMLILIMSAMLLFAGCGTKDDNAGTKDDNAATEDENVAKPDENNTGTQAEVETLKVGMECTYPPFNWTQTDDSNGAVPIEGTKEYAYGYDVEIAKRIADGLGKKLVIVKTEWTGLIPSVQSGTIDAIVAGMSPTSDRKEDIDFSDNYYKSDLVMVVKKGGPYEKATSIQDFAGAKITGQLGTFHYTVIDQIKGVKKEAAMDDFGAMRVALESGIIDGYVSEKPEGVSATAANDKLAMIEFTEGFETSDEDTAIAVGLKKNSDMTSKINEILAGISEEDRSSIMDNAIASQPAAE